MRTGIKRHGGYRSLALAGVMLAFQSGCSWDQPVAAPQPSAQERIPEQPALSWPSRPEHAIGADAKASLAVEVALAQVGVPYRYGGRSPSGFDCSGLVQFAYEQSGVPLPRTTRQLWRTVTPVADRRSLLTGDLVFFDFGDKPSHVGLAIDEVRFVHAPSTGSQVRIDRLDDPTYASRLTGVRRPLPAAEASR